MSIELEKIKRAIARVTVSDGVSKAGTGFYIGDGYVITALHVVSGRESIENSKITFAKSIKLNFYSANHETTAETVEAFWDLDEDWIILKCTDSPKNVSPLELGVFDPDDIEKLTWESFGYPSISAEETDGLKVRGEIGDINATYKGHPVIQVSVKEASAGSGAPLHGLSGGPCLVEGKAVGVLRSTLVRQDLNGQMEWEPFTVGGTAYATSAKKIIAWQASRGVAILPGNWAPPDIIGKDFLVFLSQQEGQNNNIKLRSIVEVAHKQLGIDILSKPSFKSAGDIITSEENIEYCIKALCHAKVVVFDATEFEPAIMFLIGIRSVVKRGITILSVGGNYALGDPLNIPFNITDANIVAHSKKQDKSRMANSVKLLANRIRRGLAEISNIRYLDLPVYDVIRKLPPNKRGVIPEEEGVLVLCPYAHEDYLHFWENNLKPALENGLEELRQERDLGKKIPDFGVSRSFELNSARIVTQAIYEAIRRFNTCVVDLTSWSPNVLFELGVRLAVTPSNRRTVCIIEKDWNSIKPPTDCGEQQESFVKLFISDQFIYSKTKSWVEENAFSNAYSKSPAIINSNLLSGGLHSIASSALDVENEPAFRPVYQDLLDEAEIFSKFAGQAGKSKPVSIFSNNQELIEKEEQAAFERLFTAWLYLSYLLKLSDDILNTDHTRKVCSTIVDALLERHIALLSEEEIESLGNIQDKIEEMNNHV